MNAATGEPHGKTSLFRQFKKLNQPGPNRRSDNKEEKDSHLLPNPPIGRSRKAIFQELEEHYMTCKSLIAGSAIPATTAKLWLDLIDEKLNGVKEERERWIDKSSHDERWALRPQAGDSRLHMTASHTKAMKDQIRRLRLLCSETIPLVAQDPARAGKVYPSKSAGGETYHGRVKRVLVEAFDEYCAAYKSLRQEQRDDMLAEGGTG